MAEPTLSLAYDDFQTEVSRYLGYAADVGDLSVAQVAEIDRIIQAGYRQFLYPPAIEGVEVGYEWSFLKPTTTLTTHTTYDTGTVTVVGTTCTLTGGTWPTWLTTEPDDAILTIDEVEYTVTSRDSAVQLTVSESGDVADETFDLTSDGSQDLPDDFGRVVGDFHFEANECNISIPIVSEHFIQMKMQQSIDEGRPQYAAVRYKDNAGTGQRQEVVFWPIPDDSYVLTYLYEAFTGKLVTGEYPVGGMKHSEVIVESCMAIAEQRLNNEKGLHWDSFSRMLRTAVAQDMKNGARYFGQMGNLGDYYDNLERSRNYQSTYLITYKGETW